MEISTTTLGKCNTWNVYRESLTYKLWKFFCDSLDTYLCVFSTNINIPISFSTELTYIILIKEHASKRECNQLYLESDFLLVIRTCLGSFHPNEKIVFIPLTHYISRYLTLTVKLIIVSINIKLLFYIQDKIQWNYISIRANDDFIWDQHDLTIFFIG